MSVETDLRDVLVPLVNGSVYPDVAPAGIEPPYIVYQQVGGRPLAFLERALPSKKNGRFQITVWSKSRIEAAELTDQVAQALIEASLFEASLLSEVVALHDGGTGLRGAAQDFSIWSDRA